MEPTWQKTGGYRALVNPQIDSEALRQSLASIESLASAPDATLLQAGRHRTVRLALDCGGGRRIDAVAKFFGRQSPLKDIADRVIGTKAHRTYDAARFLASQGIGTTPPIACLERWRGPRLTSCVFVSAFVAGATCFKDRLVELWRSRAPYSEFRDAIGAAARGVRALHDAGCTHGDLGNQNIFFSPDPDGGPCGDALFMDLNRARFDDVPLPMARRARDLARICLPEGFMDVFMRLYWGEEPPRAFMREWRLHHRLFRIHSATRKYRHPIRELDYALNPQKAPAQASYPPRRLQWVWDDKAMRPAPVAHDATLLSYLEPRYRSRLLRNSRALARRFSAATLAARPPRLDIPSATPLLRRLAICDADLASAAAALEAAGLRHALFRIPQADQPELAARRLAAARALAASGFGVALQLLQVPRFLGGETFDDFASRVIVSCGFTPDWVCAGQGIGQPEWGVRTQGEQDALLATASRLASDRRPGAPRIVSPAVECPVMGPFAAASAAIFATNAPYAGIALAWRRGDAPFADEAHALRTLSAASFYARAKLIAICDEAPATADIAPAAAFLAEVCASRF